jgi:maltooligosyltrehalose trehalohydrolase
MPWGSYWSDGKAEFWLWAPEAVQVTVELNDGRLPATSRTRSGFWHLEAACTPGSTYCYSMILTSGETLRVPDPASRGQSGDVDDSSCVVDPDTFVWKNSEWLGRPWHEAVVYELHVGLLGGFIGVTERLPALAALGITAIELMPVADFPGSRNWGYDGVLPFAPDASYGSPEDLKHLIDTAHGLGLMVLLDVVYNHFGPDGNYLAKYAPQFFHRESTTAWGGAIDFSAPEVRSFFSSNAIYWIMEYRFDGLRIDAAHAIVEQDWLVEMADAVRTNVEPDRHVHLILEHDGNAANLLTRGFDAQWNDDGHHILHRLLTNESDSYYADYVDKPAEKLARLLSEGFIYQSDPSPFRGGALRGEPSAELPTTSFVFFLQNHDQTGNRAFGERLTTLAGKAALRAAQALQLLTPHIPLIFMGEESESTTPFLYFTSHRTEELAAAVRSGRQKEFAATIAFSDEAARAKIPDPNDEGTFERSRPDFVGDQGDSSTAWMKDLLALRRRHITPYLRDCKSLGAEVIGEAAVVARWKLGSQRLTLTINLGPDSVELAPETAPTRFSVASAAAETIFDTGGVRKQLALGKVPAHAFLAALEPL